MRSTIYKKLFIGTVGLQGGALKIVHVNKQARMPGSSFKSIYNRKYCRESVMYIP